MSFFEDKLYRLIEALGKAGVGGHEKVEERELVFEKSGGVFETTPCGLDDEIDDPFSVDDFSSRRSTPRLDLGGGNRNASKWRRVRLFLSDLMDYSIDWKSAENQEYWRKMDEWEFEGKLVWNNRSYLRLNRFSLEGAV